MTRQMHQKHLWEYGQRVGQNHEAEGNNPRFVQDKVRDVRLCSTVGSSGGQTAGGSGLEADCTLAQ